MEEQQQDIFHTPPAYKLFSAESVRVGSFLGGPLVAAWLMTENEKKLERTGKGMFIWITAILVMVIAFFLAFSLPAKFPPILIPLAYSFAASGFTQYLQGDLLKAHTGSGGMYWSRWRAAGVGLLGAVLMIGIYVGIFLILDQYFSVDISRE